MKLLIAKLIKNVLKAILGKKMLFWSLRFWSKQTENLIDDNIVALVEAADKNDTEGMLNYSQKLIEEVTKAMKK